MSTHTDQKTTIDPSEVEKFSAMAAEWWDPFGKFKPLHKLNPVRLSHIRDRICEHFGRDRLARTPLEGLSVLDIGCGGGLVSEPMARLGADITGIDAAERNIKIAMTHARSAGLEIDYRHISVEELAETGAQYDVVLNLEVVEHVADVGLFLDKSAEVTRPGGMMVVATINRTPQALLTAKIGAEYVLRWLPAGTHDPRKFLKPSEIADHLRKAGMQPGDPVGINYQVLTDSWRTGKDASVNYMMMAAKPAA